MGFVGFPAWFLAHCVLLLTDAIAIRSTTDHSRCLLIRVLACSDLTWAGGQDPQPGLGSEGQESLWGRRGESCRQQLSSAGGACDD